jgi:hypothetical protein
VSVCVCANCGSETSTHARCECGAISEIPSTTLPSTADLRRGAGILCVAGLALAVTASLHEIRILQDRATAQRLQAAKMEEANTIASHAQERQQMIAKADSVLRTTPILRIPGRMSEALFRGVAIVEWRSDETAKRWVRAATHELRARSTPRKRK